MSKNKTSIAFKSKNIHQNKLGCFGLLLCLFEDFR